VSRDRDAVLFLGLLLAFLAWFVIIIL